MRIPAFIFVLALLLAPACLSADEPAPGTVTFSDGRALTGKISLTPNQKIQLFDLTTKKRFNLALDEIRRIETLVEKEEMCPLWVWKEDGSNEKIILPGKYPHREFATTVTLTGGQQLKGHVMATVIYIEVDEDTTERVFLKREDKGEKGTELADLVYVKEISFGSQGPGNAAPARWGSITGVLPGAKAVTAVDITRGKFFQGKVDPASGRFRVPNLLHGNYALFYQTADTLVGGFAPAKKGTAGLSDEDSAAVKARLGEIEEFFDQKGILKTAGGPEQVCLLIEMRREAGTTLRDEETGQSDKFQRWELWTCHKGDLTWQIDSRLFLFREHVKSTETLPHWKFRFDEKLASIPVTAEKPEARVE